MKRACFVCLSLCLTTTFLLSQLQSARAAHQNATVVPQINASPADPKAQDKILDQYGKLPLSFEANRGQTDSQVKFLSRTGGYTLFLTGDESVLALSAKKASGDNSKIARNAQTLASSMPAPKAGGVLRMKLRSVNPAAKVTGMNELSGTSNYFIGNDPAKWRTNVPTYAKVKYEGIYSGIDLVYYGNQGQLEYDFIVAPGADPHRIQFDVRGAKRIRQDEDGDLILNMREGEIRWHKPVVYQEKDGTRQEIAAHYAITDTNRVGFKLAKYDASTPLYIDPLIYSTYLGGNGYDRGALYVAVDRADNAYVIGTTSSPDFPIATGAFQRTCGSCYYENGNWYGNAFVTKINPSGSALVYSTYLGGSNNEEGFGIAVDSEGDAYVTGFTTSTNFPVTPGAFQTTYGGGVWNAFVTKINPTGSALVYSTYLGSDQESYTQGIGIAVDSSGNAYVTGPTTSTNFPVTPGAFQTTCGGSCWGNAFVTKFNPTGSALVYSTYLGGSGRPGDNGFGIAVDSAGNAYVTGDTSSTDFPTMNPLQPVYGGGDYDAFVSEINPTGSALVYSTFLGGSGIDESFGIAIDSTDNAYVTGFTGSTNFPVTPGAFQTANAGGYDAFVTKFNPTGSALVYSTYLGGSENEDGPGRVGGIAVDSAGNTYITGGTSSTNFPVTSNAFQSTLNGGVNAFVTKVNPSGSALAYSTYLGGSGGSDGAGITVDSGGNAYVVGGAGGDFPITSGAFQTTCGGSCLSNGFVSKIVTTAASATSLLSSINPSESGKPVTFTALVSSPEVTPTGKIQFLNGTTVLATLKLTSGSAKYTTSKLPAGSNSITAVYEGDSKNNGSTSAPVNQIVMAVTTTTLLSSPNPSTYGRAVTFTASVASKVGAPPNGETVSFMKGTTVLGTEALVSGSTGFTTSSLPVGTSTITAVYGGDSNLVGSTSKAMKQVVDKGGSGSFTLTASPGTLTVAQGSSGTTTITIMPAGGFDQGVTLSTSGTPMGVTASFNQNPTTSISTLTLKVSGSTATGDSTITIDGTSGNLFNQVSLSLRVVQ